ncbi:hypothetical protein AB0B94_31170 [Micromonospora sp. NPDC048986]|uniref:hypothetical protein n=1 Tax=Micromonospora sp. NPDC048986 TaxID=3155644 RepID=UPI0033CC0C09
MTDVTNTELPDGLLEYFAARERQRAETINKALATLSPYERRLVREAAVMGYVRGAMAGKHREDVPGDGAILAEVLGACITMGDLYPYLAAASEGCRRRVTKSRRWPGE